MPHRQDIFMKKNAPQARFFCEKTTPQVKNLLKSAPQAGFF